MLGHVIGGGRTPPTKSTQEQKKGKRKSKKGGQTGLSDAKGDATSKDLEGAKHVAATALTESFGEAAIFVAKNEGLDNEDEKMLAVLNMWIQCMANTGVRPSIAKDPVWAKLLVYYDARIAFYIKRFIDTLPDLQMSPSSDMSSSFAQKLNRLHTLCADLMTEGQFEFNQTKVAEVVSLANELRLDLKFQPYMSTLSPGSRARTVYTTVCYLGRIRSAYETIKEAAMHFAFLKKFKIHPVRTTDVESLQVDLSFITKTLNLLGTHVKEFSEKAPTVKRFCETRRIVHAEIQVLLEIKTKSVTPRIWKYSHTWASARRLASSAASFSAI
jgi:hypothetical protein